jgi:predicted RNA-binding Zn-ribbon protein involved in translation (DUF1610 family)
MTDEKRKREPDEMFCSSCGEPIKRDAVICVHCGVQVARRTRSRHGASPSSQLTTSEDVKPKSKATAIILAVFFGPWTWLYTYRRDCWKFWMIWINPFVIVTDILLAGIVHGWAFLHAYQPPQLGMAALNFFFWLWALLMACIRNQEWYENYPQG